MRFLSLSEILVLHKEVIATSRGVGGVRDLGALESAINQPRITFDQQELYPDLVSKAAALCESSIFRWQLKSWSRCNGGFSFPK